jgi:hypothetical protein
MLLRMEQRSSDAQSIGELLKERNIVLRGADRFTQNGFTQVPNSLLKSTDLSVGAKLTYAMLLHYAWQNDFCFPGQDRLAKDIGIGLRSSNRYIKELEARAYVRILRRGLGRVNIYELHIRAAKVRGSRRPSQMRQFGISRYAGMARHKVPN